MDTDKLIHGDYKFILDEFGVEKLKSRYETILSYLNYYIQINGLENDVIVSKPLLDNLVIDYFVDIYRMKDFQEIRFVNDAKIYAYTAYWLLRRKPLQLIKPNLENKYSFINENMVAAYLFSFLFSDPHNIEIVSGKENDFDEFKNNLLYSFMYREYSPKMIETFICAFKAGRAYQYSVDFDD